MKLLKKYKNILVLHIIGLVSFILFILLLGGGFRLQNNIFLSYIGIIFLASITISSIIWDRFNSDVLNVKNIGKLLFSGTRENWKSIITALGVFSLIKNGFNAELSEYFSFPLAFYFLGITVSCLLLAYGFRDKRE